MITLTYREVNLKVGRKGFKEKELNNFTDVFKFQENVGKFQKSPVFREKFKKIQETFMS